MQVTRPRWRTSVYALWTVSMAWHLWRIATLRPSYEHLSDDGKTLGSFAAVYVVAGVVRHAIFGPTDVFGALGSLALHSLLLLILFERSDRASTLVAACLGASALFDMLIVALSGVAPVLSETYLVFYIEIAFMLVLRHKFLQQPAHVQARAYNRK